MPFCQPAGILRHELRQEGNLYIPPHLNACVATGTAATGTALLIPVPWSVSITLHGCSLYIKGTSDFAVFVYSSPPPKELSR